MQQLLIAVQAELRNRIGYIRKQDIYIAPSVYTIDVGAKMPCIGIKDGKPSSRDLAGGVVETMLPVHFSVFVRLAKEPERAIIGDVSTSRPGVLAVAEDIKQLLLGNLLGFAPEIQAARLTDESESEMYVDPQSKGIQRKQLTITYTRETAGTCGG